MPTELTDQIKHLESELAALKVRVEKECACARQWVPKDGERYWFYTTTGPTHWQHWLRDKANKDFLAMGNVFPTQEDAENAVRKQKAMVKLKSLTKGFAPDWENKYQLKFDIYFDYANASFSTNRSTLYQGLNQVYFATREDAQTAITTMGDQMKDFLL